MKRVLISFLFVLIILSAVAPLVSAQYIGIREASEQAIELVIETTEPFLQVLLGGQDYTGWLLFERFLIFILLLSVTYIAVGNIPAFSDNKGIIWIIAIIVPLIAVRNINYAWLNTILLQYQVLGIALTAILPFIIFLYFLHSISENPTIRKIGWIFFIVVYYGLWTTTASITYGQVYLWTMIIALIFLFFDGTIHRTMLKQRLKDSEKGPIYQRIADIDSNIAKIEKSGIPEKTKQKQIRRLEKERERLYKSI